MKKCCDTVDDCCQGRACPLLQTKTIQYHTGFDRLDALLGAISYGVAILGALCLIWALVLAGRYFFLGA